jgi:hypothetical protein
MAQPGALFTCTFAAHAGSCILPNGAAVSFRQNEVTASDPDGVRSFAGLRLDPSSWTCPGKWKRERLDESPSKHREPTRWIV